MHPVGFTISFWILLGLLHHGVSVERGTVEMLKDKHITFMRKQFLKVGLGRCL